MNNMRLQVKIKNRYYRDRKIQFQDQIIYKTIYQRYMNKIINRLINSIMILL